MNDALTPSSEISKSSHPIVLTVGRGRRRPMGARVEIDPTSPVDALGLALSLHDGEDGWWSGGAFVDDRRANDRWCAQQVLSVDVDHHDPLGQHAPLTDEATATLVEALRVAPCTLWHLTPRGARLVFLLDVPIVDKATYARAWKSLAARWSAWCPRLSLGELRVDDQCKDLARFYFTPNATVDGIRRDSGVHEGAAPWTSLADLLAETSEKLIVSASSRSRERSRGQSDNLSVRARAYLAKVEPSISGQGGDAALFAAARAVVAWERKGLAPGEALSLLCEFNARCQPPLARRPPRVQAQGSAHRGPHASRAGRPADGKILTGPR